MRSLSTHRRHPLAGVVVLLLGLVIVGGLYSTLAPRSAQAEDIADDAALVEAGRELFLVGCASCHGLNAQGVLQSRGGQYGPSLIGVGAASVDFQVGTGRMPLAQNSQQAPSKPEVYDDDEVEALAAYVASLAPGPAIPGPEYYDTTGLSEEEIVEGGEFFRTNCTACHNSVGIGGALGGGRYAPSLEGVEGKYFAEAMLTGPQSMPVFSDEVITPEDKRNIVAYVEEVQGAPSNGGLSLGGVGPVAEGLVGWVVGIGGLVLAAIWITKAAMKVGKQ